MNIYTAKVKGLFFWKEYQLVGDDFTPGGCRVLLLADNARVELPKNSLIIFSPARHEAIKQRIRQDGAQI